MQRRSVIPIVTAVAATLALAEPAGKGDDWPQLRGLHRDGVSAETGLANQWPEGGPKEVWRVPIGEGYSAISIVGDRLYTMYAGQAEGKALEFAAAFDAATGKELWRTAIAEKFDNEFGNGPRATPSIDGDSLFVLGSRGDFAALSTKDGTARWRVNFIEAFGAEMPTFGFSTSAVTDGDQVIVEGGGKEGKSYVALDKKTGAVRWTMGDTGVGYNSPLPVDAKGGRQYVYLAADKLAAIDGKGQELWSHAWPRGETHAMPVFVPPDRYFASGAEGVGAALVRVNAGGSDVKVEEVWKSPTMRNHFSSSIAHGDHIYGFDNATLKCIRVADGELAWVKRGLGKGSLILADGRLLVLSDRGQLVLVDARADAYHERGSVQALDGKSWTAPSMSRGRLYLRNHTEMVSYDVRG